jgi:hypothetical protein
MHAQASHLHSAGHIAAAWHARSNMLQKHVSIQYVIHLDLINNSHVSMHA